MKRWVTAMVLGATVGMLIPERAHAARVPVVINRGQEIFTAGPLPEPVSKIPQLAGYEAAFKCDVMGIFWTYFSISNCHPVAFNGNDFVDEASVSAAVSKTYKESDMKVGVWGRFGWMIFLVLVLAGVAVWVKSFFSGDSDDDDDDAHAEAK